MLSKCEDKVQTVCLNIIWLISWLKKCALIIRILHYRFIHQANVLHYILPVERCSKMCMMHAHTQTFMSNFQCVQFVACVWVSVLWSRPSAPSYLLHLSPVVLYPSGGLPPPCQSRHQLESYALNFSLLFGTHYVIFI